MNYIFIKNGRSTGMHRFLETIETFGDFEIVFVKSIQDTNNYECKHAIFGNFLPQELQHNEKAEKKYYTFCSPFGQADLSSYDFYSSEIQILWMCKYEMEKGHIDGVVTQSRSLSNLFGFIYIPPVKIWHHKTKNTPIEQRKHIGLLGNNKRKHKNIVNQIAAISMLDPKVDIVVNEDIYKNFEYLFGCNFIVKQGLSDKEYYEEISHHHLATQCSWSEAFDYQAFEYMFYGIPVICSPSLYWISGTELEPIVMVENVDDPVSIYVKMDDLIYDTDLYKEASYLSVKIANTINKQNKELLTEIIEEKFG